MDGLLAQFPSPSDFAKAVAEHIKSNLISDSFDYNIPGVESNASEDWFRDTLDIGEITDQLWKFKLSKSPRKR